MRSIVDYLDHWAEHQPDKCLFSFLNGRGIEREGYSYRAFRDRTRHLAVCLTQQLGLRSGDRALLVYPPGLEVIAAFYACARVGVIPVPVYPPAYANFAVGLPKLAFVARDCEPKALLTTRRLRDVLAPHLGSPRAAGPWPGAPAIPALACAATDELHGRPLDDVRSDPGPVLFLQYTSGSTSDPKGVVVSHANVIHNALASIDHVPTAVSWLPQYHDLGLIGSYIFPVILGGTTYGFAPMDFVLRPLLWLETITRVRATGTSSPNFGFEHCLREDKVPASRLASLDLSSLRLLANAAEPVRTRTYERFVARFAACGLRPEACIAGYGLAENTLAVTHFGRRIAVVDRHLMQQGRLRLANARTPERNRLPIMSCGRAIAGVDLRIVNPDSRTALGEGQIGEIWVAGPSTCQGYWNRPGLTRETFRNAITNDTAGGSVYMRTGDLGFVHDEELFVCGRIKDLVIIRGVNYYPQDIEAIVESASHKVRTGGVAAFAVEDAGEALVVVAEVRSSDDLPDPEAICRALRTQYCVEPHTIAFVPSGTIAKTTSGKIARRATRQRWLEGALPTLAVHRNVVQQGRAAAPGGLREQFRHLLEPYALTGSETFTLAEMGVDSISLATLLGDFRQLLAEHGLADLIDEVDLPLLHRVTIAELFSMLDRTQDRMGPSLAKLRSWLATEAHVLELHERERMRSDAELEPLGLATVAPNDGPSTDILLTGVTGFLGPFLLHRFLQRTSYTCHVLVRAADPEHGMNRVRAALRRTGLWSPRLDEELQARVRIVCGDLGLPRLGLDAAAWAALAAGVQAILHCAAVVNYNLPYDALRTQNVEATRDLLRLAATTIRKEFHFVSTTFIFGWTTERTLMESDNNDAMANLDFGYAQSKWVAEHLVLAARRQGLTAPIYRSSMISASTGGYGNRDDVVVRLLAFMINHGLAVNSTIQISLVPADVAADNIVAIFAQRSTGGRTLHVAADRYYNIVDITRVIARNYGYSFTYHDIPAFVAALNRLCGKGDPLYPLLDFINRSQAKVALMQNKRYGSDAYRAARKQAAGARHEPPLAEVVDCIMAYLRREGLVAAAPRDCEPEAAPLLCLPGAD